MTNRTLLYFYPRSPCGERRKHQRQGAGGERISIHALLAESDAGCASGNPARRPFLSTLSLRRATGVPFSRLAYDYKFLSTLSLRRATCGVCWMSLWMRYFYPRSPCGERRTKTALTSTVLNFYPRSPCGERHLPQRNCAAGAKFLSTLSLRRATITLKEYAFRHGNFYPRSPCGERRFSFWRCTAQRIFLSTLSLRRATLPGGDRPRHAGISIHALLAESDPRSRWVPRHTQISIHALLAESDQPRPTAKAKNNTFLSTLSLRRATALLKYTKASKRSFLSTLSLRRATCHIYGNYANHSAISIHALLAESDLWYPGAEEIAKSFLSTLSLRRATEYCVNDVLGLCISIHALLAESDQYGADLATVDIISIHALLAESDAI